MNYYILNYNIIMKYYNKYIYINICNNIIYINNIKYKFVL